MIIVMTVLLISGFFVVKKNNSAKAWLAVPDWPASSSSLNIDDSFDSELDFNNSSTLFLPEIIAVAVTSTAATNPDFNTSTEISATSTATILTTTSVQATTSSGQIDYLISTSSASTTAVAENLSTTTVRYIWSQIKINEIVSDPEEGNEWVELYNFATSSLDLAGGVICDNTEKSCKTTTGTVESASWLVVDLGTNRYLNNGGDSVILKNSVGEITDSVNYGSNLPAPVKGQSLARKVDGIDTDSESDWAVTTQITAGLANVIFILSQPIISSNSGGVVGQSVNQAQTASQTDGWTINQIASSTIIASTTSSTTFLAIGQVVISEIYPNPPGLDGEQEYIAIKNLSSSAINLQDWQLSDLAKSFTLSGYILPGQTITWGRTTTSLALNNTQPEVVSLINSQGKLVDKVGYNRASEGQIYRRAGEEWGWTDLTVGPIESNEDDEVENKAEDKFFDSEIPKGKESSTTLAVEMSLAQVRGVEKGELVKVSGIVSVLPGVFASQYYYITDGYSGIQIYNYQKEFPVLAVGDKVEVVGEVSEAYGMKRIKVKDKTEIIVRQRGLSLATVSSSLTGLDESRLGSLIKVKGIVTELKGSYMYVDDGSSEIMVNFKGGAKIDGKKFKEGENIEVVGILEQGRTAWQLWPRSPGDIKPLSLPEPVEPIVGQEQPLTVAVADPKDAAEKYLAVTASGMATLFLGFLVKARGMFVWKNLKKVVGLLAIRFKDRN